MDTGQSSSETSFTPIAPPVFNGENYQVWAIRMEAFLDAVDLWEAVEEDYEVLPLPDNPTIAQMKTHKTRKSRKSKAKACLFNSVSPEIFTRIMALKTAFAIWKFLKEEYEGNEKIKGMQVMNLVREFEMQKMKESETIKEYLNRLLGIVNKVRLLGSEFSDTRIVQKILVTIPERFEATIASLENAKDLSRIGLAELVHALQAQEQRRLMRSEGSIEGALPAKVQSNQKDKKDFPPCKHCGRKGHPPFKCWRRPDQQCEKCRKMGHHQKICTSDFQQENVTQVNLQQKSIAQAANQHEEEQLFVATCFAASSSSEKWLIDSGCTNHMTFDRDLFKDLDTSINSKVRIGNGEYIAVKGKGTVAIKSLSGTKILKDVLYVPEINQNLLSVGQMLERGFRVFFEDNKCLIKDTTGEELFQVKMKNKSLSLNPSQEEQAAFSTVANVTETWHKRLGHFHHAALLNLQRKELAKGLPQLESELSGCNACQYGKQARLPFQKSSWRATERL